MNNLQLKEKGFYYRITSTFLAILICIMCIPQNDYFLMSFAEDTNQEVLTNVSITFNDERFNQIEDVTSNEVFYLIITLSGNNVNLDDNKDNYRIYITDNNLLLINFAGNGLIDGSTYNGFTLHINKNDNGEIEERYLEYNIDNEETKELRLPVKFANGKTANQEKCSVVVVQTSTNKSISEDIFANSQTEWSSFKTQNKSFVEFSDIISNSGVTIDYTVSASPDNISKSNGAWWITSLKLDRKSVV